MRAFPLPARPMSAHLRPAQIRDIGHIMSLAQHGARHGHFDARICQDKSGYRTYLSHVIQHGVDPWGHSAELSVVERMGVWVGATLVTEAVGTPDQGVEIAMIALKPKDRGLGIGHLVLDSLLSRYLPIGSVYARCMPASSTLHQMLLRRDFEAVGNLENSVILRHPAVRLTDTSHLGSSAVCPPEGVHAAYPVH